MNPVPGLTVTEMVDGALTGQIKAMIVMGENPMMSEPNLSHAQHALEELDLLLCIDIFMNETGEMADVILPSASFAEKDGTFTNSDRRVQRVRQALPAVGESLPDWEIVCALAKRMENELGITQSAGFDYADVEEIWEEMRSLTPDFYGITYERLNAEGGVHWPCPAPDHPGTPYLFEDDFPRGKGKFWELEYGTESELPDDAYPYHLTTGRVLFHWHGGTMTRSSRLEEAFPVPIVEMHPADAGALQVVSGDWLRITSRRGQVECQVMVTGRSPAGTIFLPFHFVEAAANLLTLDKIDPRAKIPDFKMAAVKLEKVARNRRRWSNKARSKIRCILCISTWSHLTPTFFCCARLSVMMWLRGGTVMSKVTTTSLPEDKIREYCTRQPIRQLSLFGSALRNELTPESDIDLLVEYLPEAPVGYFAMAQHMMDLSEIVGRRVDLATPNSLSPYIRQEILDSAELLYAQDQGE